MMPGLLPQADEEVRDNRLSVRLIFYSTNLQVIERAA